jgi:hypothetical protein
VDIRSGGTKVLADLGPSPPANNPVKGLSLSPDGTFVTSVLRLRGDLWLLTDLPWPKRTWWDSIWRQIP